GREDLSVRSGLEDPFHRVLEDTAVLLFRAPQGFLHPLAFRDVAMDDDNAGRVSRAVANEPRPGFYRNGAPVLAHEVDFIDRRHFPPRLQAPRTLFRERPRGGGEEVAEVTPQQFLPGPAEQRLRPAVHGGEDAIEGEGHDGIVGVVEKTLQGFGTLPQLSHLSPQLSPFVRQLDFLLSRWAQTLRRGYACLVPDGPLTHVLSPLSLNFIRNPNPRIRE